MTKGAAAMESLKDVTHVVVDKTGTLTEGKLKVSRLKASGIWQNDHQLLCTLITAAEEHGASAHPIGAAVFRECLKIAGDRWSKYKEFGSIRNLEEVTGGGVKCEVDVGDNRWRSVVVGSLSLMKDNNIEMLDTIPKEVDELGSLVFASIDSRLSAVIVLQVWHADRWISLCMLNKRTGCYQSRRERDNSKPQSSWPQYHNGKQSHDRL